MTAAEAAEIGGTSRQYVHNRAHKFESTRRIGTLPDPTPEDPLHRKGGMLVFSRIEIEQWASKRSGGTEDS